MAHGFKRVLAVLLALVMLGASTPQAAACGDLLPKAMAYGEELLREALGLPKVTKLATPLLPQKKDQWCWAAAALMAARTYVNNNTTQTDIVKHVKGKTINEGGTVFERLEAVKFATGGKVKFKWVDPLTKAEAMASIDAGNPIMLCRGWYPFGYPGPRYGGHSTVLYGYQVDKNGKVLFLVHDPWPPNEGETTLWTYTEIKKGADTGILEMCEIKA